MIPCARTADPQSPKNPCLDCKPVSLQASVQPVAVMVGVVATAEEAAEVAPWGTWQ